jgi:hypothetical protein
MPFVTDVVPSVPHGFRRVGGRATLVQVVLLRR